MPSDRLGRYRLLKLLGQGAMGEVWEAVLEGPHDFRKPVALKVLRAGPADERTGRALVHEARLGALLHHPNLVAIHDLGEDDGRWFVAMELVRGPTLAHLLRDGPLAPAAVIDVGVQVAQALAHVHALSIDGRPTGLVHRDVKPSNVLLDPSGLAKLGDLGVAAFAGAPGTPVGTPSYMPPEQLDGAVDPRSDLFALGATLFTLALGRRPFGAGRDALLAARKVEAALDRGLVDPADEVVPGLAAVLRACLRARPEDRWPRARELAAALEALRPRAGGPGLREAGGDAFVDPVSTRTVAATATVAVRRGNLPAARDRFFGRGEEVDALARRLRAGPDLVTLIGLGGAGKTRLALEAAGRVQLDLDGGAWFFDLSEARDAPAAAEAVARALEIQLDGADPVGQIGRALAARGRAALVLDNLEQIADAPELVRRWRAACAEASLLCTSRSALRLRGERIVSVGPLATDDGVALFEDRAPGADGDPATVRALVDALEGHSLSIELAAARTRFLRPHELLRRTTDALRLLAGGEHDRPERHRSLRASLEGSWELLTDGARAALAQLTVCEAGFTLATAEAVVDPALGWAVDLVEELASASLVRVDPESGRFSLPVVVRAFAAEQLGTDERLHAEVRHGRCFAQLGVDDALARTDAGGAFATWAAETEDLVAACTRASARGDTAVAFRAGIAAYALLSRRGPLGRARAVLEAALRVAVGVDRSRLEARLATELVRSSDRPEAQRLVEHTVRAASGTPYEAETCFYAATVYGTLGDRGAADALAERALALYRAAGDLRGEAATLSNRGVALSEQARFAESVRSYEEAVAVAQRAGYRHLEGIARGNLGNTLVDHGRLVEAEPHLDLALRSHRETGDRRFEGRALGNLGNLYVLQGRTADGIRCYEAALAVHREVGNRRSEAITLGNLGLQFLQDGRFDDARRALEGALRLHREVADRRGESATLCNLADLDAAAGDGVRARRSYTDARALAVEAGDPRIAAIVVGRIGELDLTEGRFAEALATLGEAEGAMRELADGRELPVVLAARAEALARCGRRDEALAALEEARTLCGAAGFGDRSQAATRVARAAARLDGR